MTGDQPKILRETMDLSRLASPFPADDIEWRVSRSGTGSRGPWCKVLAYITARAIQERLDEVCGPANWRNEEPKILDLGGKPAFVGGISITIPPTNYWVTKWDVSEPTQIEPVKGGFSGAMKRAGAEWGIGRYLYHLDEAYAEVETSDPGRGWNWAKLKQEGTHYWWKPPKLPAWALPKEPDSEVSQAELNTLKASWKGKFSGDEKDRARLAEGFRRFVVSLVGEFPVEDHKCWTRETLAACESHIQNTSDPKDVSAEIPFGEQL